jgi:hypothetical protein
MNSLHHFHGNEIPRFSLQNDLVVWEYGFEYPELDIVPEIPHNIVVEQEEKQDVEEEEKQLDPADLHTNNSNNHSTNQPALVPTQLWPRIEEENEEEGKDQEQVEEEPQPPNNNNNNDVEDETLNPLQPIPITSTSTPSTPPPPPLLIVLDGRFYNQPETMPSRYLYDLSTQLPCPLLTDIFPLLSLGQVPSPRRHMGWMKKLGHFAKTWKTRFFVLESGFVTYYVKQQAIPPFGEEMKGQICLAGYRIIPDSDPTSKTMTSSSSQQRRQSSTSTIMSSMTTSNSNDNNDNNNRSVNGGLRRRMSRLVSSSVGTVATPVFATTSPESVTLTTEEESCRILLRFLPEMIDSIVLAELVSRHGIHHTFTGETSYTDQILEEYEFIADSIPAKQFWIHMFEAHILYMETLIFKHQQASFTSNLLSTPTHSIHSVHSIPSSPSSSSQSQSQLLLLSSNRTIGGGPSRSQSIAISSPSSNNNNNTIVPKMKRRSFIAAATSSLLPLTPTTTTPSTPTPTSTTDTTNSTTVVSSKRLSMRRDSSTQLSGQKWKIFFDKEEELILVGKVEKPNPVGYRHERELLLLRQGPPPVSGPNNTGGNSNNSNNNNNKRERDQRIRYRLIYIDNKSFVMKGDIVWWTLVSSPGNKNTVTNKNMNAKVTPKASKVSQLLYYINICLLYTLY